LLLLILKTIKMSEIENANAYDVNKKYTWGPEDTFQLSGREFGLVLNALRSVLNTPEAAQIILANEANKSIEEVMAKAVSAGVVKEVTE
jgi:hypothetical protein